MKMRWLCVLMSFLCANSVCGFRHSTNNVCRTLADYKTISYNKNCWYNPDVGSSPLLIAKRNGYPFETHSVTTKDGYILTLHRIPRSRNELYSNEQKTRRQPIIIQHGLAGTSAFWILQGKKSIAFFLADNGFDVWLSNSRGTLYSSKHVSMNMDNPDYWNFGFHEMAIYDLPASIDFIANKTGEKGNLIYVGHSMGTTISYIYSVVEKQHAENNLKGIISLAPVAHMKNIKGVFKIFANHSDFLKNLFQSLGITAVGQYHQLQKAILSVTCSQYPLIYPCNWLLIAASGFSKKEFQPEILPVFFSFYPSAMSRNTLLHFSQIINSNGRFLQFDYGPTKNMEFYNSTEPPEYDLGEISVPIHLFVGENDIVGDLTDAKILDDKLNVTRTHNDSRIYVFPFSHNDFFLARNLQPFHKTILNVIQTKIN